MTRKPLTDDDVKRVAIEAGVDHRTARRVLVDLEPPRSRATSRALVVALRSLGFERQARKVESYE